MEELKEDNKKARKYMETMDEKISKKIEEQMTEFRRERSEANEKWNRTNQKLDNVHKSMNADHRRLIEKIQGDRKQSIETIKEIPNNKNMEQLNQKIEDNGEEIENKEETSALLSEKKHNRNKENIKHIEVNICLLYTSRCV